MDVSVIVPANNEEAYIGACLEALRGQQMGNLRGEVIVAANACDDGTVEVAECGRSALEARGWILRVLNLPEPGKVGAFNAADQLAVGDILIYLDADVVMEPDMIAALHTQLAVPGPRYASGVLRVARAKSWVTRRFATTWQRLPFMVTNVQGAGLFAVNRAGRARWGTFPDIIADDAYVRLLFAPDERVKVSPAYIWPLVEGFRRLVRVRRRQDAGVQEIAVKFPGILANESKPPMRVMDHLMLLARIPVSYLVYVSVMLAVKLGPRNASGWTRGR
ncbi:MAG: glycosyltransferase family 2 protein [Pseudomonadota bacterium]